MERREGGKTKVTGKIRIKWRIKRRRKRKRNKKTEKKTEQESSKGKTMGDMNYNDRGPVRVLSKGVVSYVGTGGAFGTIKVCSPPPKFTFPSSKGMPPTLTLTISSMKARVSTPAVYVSE
jgi:hypothetical protein